MVVVRGLTLWSGAALDCLQAETPLCPRSLVAALGAGSEMHEHLLEHIYSHWEHPLDGVRHQTRSLFRNLLLLHRCTDRTTRDPAKDPYIRELTSNLLSLEWHLRGKYGSLGCLVELYGARFLLEVQPELPSDLLDLMGDQTLAPYASDLLEKLFLSHKEQLEASADSSEDWMKRWHRTWVTPLLRVLCHTKLDQTTYILDYFLPKLLRCSPSSLAHMVQVLQDPPLCRAGPEPAEVLSEYLKLHFSGRRQTLDLFHLFRSSRQSGGAGGLDHVSESSPNPRPDDFNRRGSLGRSGSSLPAAAGSGPQTRAGEFPPSPESCCGLSV